MVVISELEEDAARSLLEIADSAARWLADRCPVTLMRSLLEIADSAAR
jgi:hypothetical protein